MATKKKKAAKKLGKKAMRKTKGGLMGTGPTMGLELKAPAVSSDPGRL